MLWLQFGDAKSSFLHILHNEKGYQYDLLVYDPSVNQVQHPEEKEHVLKFLLRPLMQKLYVHGKGLESISDDITDYDNSFLTRNISKERVRMGSC